LTYIHQTGDTLSSSAGGDRYTGLDEFGRVIDQWWYDPSTTTTLERLQYGYDRDGNTLYENNLVDGAMSALYSPSNGTAPESQYDSLGRIQGFERGTLSSRGLTSPPNPLRRPLRVAVARFVRQLVGGPVIDVRHGVGRRVRARIVRTPGDRILRLARRNVVRGWPHVEQALVRLLGLDRPRLASAGTAVVVMVLAHLASSK
jgi:hypothetical protein